MTQEEALNILKLGRNVYLTGAAGSGKTHLLNEFIAHLKAHRVPVGVTASTGIAATHMNGQTLHSWSGVGIRERLTAADRMKIAERAPTRRRIEETRVLVIDEVSMLHPYYLDLVDDICRFVRNSDKPFGGIQVVLCGDFFQLPPVGQGRGEVAFIDESRVWSAMDLRICYLHERHRHGADGLAEVLQDIRLGTVGEHTLETLRERYRRDVEVAATPTRLHTHNARVDEVNLAELATLDAKEKRYPMYSHGSGKLVESLMKGCLAPETLRLKKGAAVMFVKNNFEAGYVNGTLGTVVGFEEGAPVVETAHGDTIEVKPETWTVEEDGKVKAEIMQLPLRLAWAITVHKSQGMTLDAAEVDLSRSFVEGMGYVALSRVRSLDGLKLMGLNDMALRVHPKVSSLDAELLTASARAVEELYATENLSGNQALWLAEIAPSDEEVREAEEKKLPTVERTRRLLAQGKSVAEIATERDITARTVVAHMEELLSTGDLPDIAHVAKGFDPERLEKIRSAFEKAGSYEKLAPARRRLGKGYAWDEIQLARVVLMAKEGVVRV